MSHRPAVIASVITAIIVAACADGTAPEYAFRKASGPAANNMTTITDWFSCATYDLGNSWTCEYTGTTYTSDGGQYIPDDDWDYNGKFKTSSDCMDKATYCDNRFHGAGTPFPNTTLQPQGDFDYQAADWTVPNCAVKQTDVHKKAYCAGKVPDATQKTRIQAALNRMRSLGGICANLAAIGDSLLNSNRMHLFSQANYKFDGGAPTGGGGSGPKSWMILSERWARLWYDSAHSHVNGSSQEPDRLTLQALLAHELDHLSGTSGHTTYANGYVSKIYTTNTQACSDVSP